MSNPFEDNGGNAWGNTNTSWGAASSSTAPTKPSTAPKPAFTQPPAKSAREIELDAREAELRSREARLAEREKEIGEYHPPNWPPFRPIVYHDISKDIPQEGQPLMKRVFLAWHFALATFILNFIAAFSLLITKAENAGSTFGVSIVMMILGTPISFTFWYRPLYTGVKHNRSIQFMMFFFNYACHLAVMVLMSIGIPGWGGAGVIYMLSQFSNNVVSAIFCMVSSAAFIFQVLYGVWQIKAVHSYWRGKGMTTDQARNQAVQGVASSKLGQEIGREAVKQTVANARS